MQFLMLRFCILGSSVGGGVLLTVQSLATEMTLSPAILFSALAGSLLMMFLGSFLAIPIGLFPASITCMLYWLVLSRFTSKNPQARVRSLLGGFLGGASSALLGALFSFSNEWPGSHPPSANIFAWAIAGAIGGAVSALSARRSTYQIVFKERAISYVA